MSKKLIIVCVAVIAIAMLVEAGKEKDRIVIGPDGQIVFEDSDKKDGGTYVISRRRRSATTDFEPFVPYPQRRLEQILMEVV